MATANKVLAQLGLFGRSKTIFGRLTPSASLQSTNNTSLALSKAASEPRFYAVGAATAAAGAGTAAGASTAGIRLFGYNISWPVLVGVSLSAVVGAYAYETKKLADIDRQPLTEEIYKMPRLPEAGALLMSQSGAKIDVCKALRGSYALMAFGALHSDDQPALEVMGRAAEMVKKRSTAMAIKKEVIPVYVSLDPIHDQVRDLKVAAGRSGNAKMLVVTGPPDGLLGSAERFKNAEMARRMNPNRRKDTKAKKAGEEVMGAGGFVSDSMYIMDPEGRVVGMVPKLSKVEEVVGGLEEAMKKSGGGEEMVV